MVKQTAAKRLMPGADLRGELEQLARFHNYSAAVLLSLVGSLTHVRLRLAGDAGFLDMDGPCEIVCATGTLSKERIHIHVAVSTTSGATFGGHLVAGCAIHTTVEVVVMDLSDEWSFASAYDSSTGYAELEVGPASN